MSVIQQKSHQNMFILMVALLQGLGLLLMHNWVIGLVKPGEYYQIIWPLYAVITTLPLSLMMLANQLRQLVIKLALTFSFLAAASAAYIGYISYVKGSPAYTTVSDSWLLGICIFVAWFIMLAFFEHFCQFKHWYKDYQALFNFSWRNLVKIITASIFAGLFWAALLLLASLFKILSIRFFYDLISNRHFVYPATTLAFGLGLSLYAAKEETLAEFKRAILQVLGWLLPLVSLILIAFIVTLPFKGLSALWGTGYATGLMLGLMCLMVFLLNAAFQDGSQIKYPAWVLQLTNIGLLTMPVYVLLCIYAMYLRVHQHGWTADRVWAASLVAIMSIYAFGYGYAAFKSLNFPKYKTMASGWMQAAKQFNILAAFSLVALLCLINSPLLNPTRIAVQSQMAKLLSGEVKAANFDFQYLRFHGGRYGIDALQALLSNTEIKDAATIKPLAEAALKAEYQTYFPNSENNKTETAEQLQKKLNTYPKGAVIDAGFYQALFLDLKSNKFYLNCLTKNHSTSTCQLLSIDLNQDGKPEIIIFDNYNRRLFSKNADGWQYLGDLQLANYQQSLKLDDLKSIAAGDYKAVSPTWQELQLGQGVYRVEKGFAP